MRQLDVAVTGLPQSGKSTFLAALWHLVTTQEIPTSLKLDTLKNEDATYLNELARRWLETKRQSRTNLAPNRLVSMRLKDDAANEFRFTFPDLSGEVFSGMWERRECDPEVLNILNSSRGVLLFIHADTIKQPRWVGDITALSKKIGIAPVEDEAISWEPKLSPTQVKQVDLLQLLRLPPLDMGPRRLVIMFSAWDKAEKEGLEPAVFLATRLPLLNQYLEQAGDGWEWRVYGVSAQGGEYHPEAGSKEVLTQEQEAEVNALLDLQLPSNRIRVVSGTGESHDLTEPIAWLTS